MSILVLEGPDFAGKSYIAGKFAARHDAKVLKQGPPPFTNPRMIMEHYLRPLEEMIGWGYITHVMDRWHIGELIYGPLLRGRSMLTEQQADYIDMVLQTFGAHFFYVTAPIIELEARYDKRGDDLIKKDQIFGITMNYDDWMVRRPHWEFVESQGWRTPKPHIHSPLAGRYIGPAKPKVLLLGDQRNDDRMIFPFVPERATSGHWLMGAMSEAGVNHMDVGILNACEINPDELLTQWYILNEPPVVVMGRNAEHAWKLTGRTPTRYVNHPQYERRFHYSAMRRYGEEIREAIDG